MNITITPDVTTIEDADELIGVALTRASSATGSDHAVAAAAVTDAYLTRARLWLEVSVPTCEQIGHLTRALHVAWWSDREHAARWWGVADRSAE